MTQQQRGQEAARILLIDETDEELQDLRDRLSGQRLAIDHAASIGAARDLLSESRYDAVLLQGNLADRGGLGLMHESSAPFIVASLPEDQDIIMSAYSAGAADFYCGSISGVELGIRLQSLLDKRQSEADGNVYHLGNSQFDLDQRQWLADGKSVYLSHHEAAFLAALLDSPKRFCTYAQLLDKIWGPAKAVETQNLRVLAGQLRRKIEPSDKPTLLLTITGVGYKLAVDPKPQEPQDASR